MIQLSDGGNIRIGFEVVVVCAVYVVEREQLEWVIGAHLVPLPGGKGKFEGADPVGPVIQITERREFWEGIMQAVQAEMAAGTPSFLISSRLDLSPWQDLPGFNKRRFKQLVDRIAAYYAIGK